MKTFDLTKQMRKPVIEQDNVMGGYMHVVCAPVYVGFKTDTIIFTRKNIANARRSKLAVV